MGKLTLQQIEAIVARGAAAGLESAELAALREALVMRTAEPDIGEKLRLVIEMLPENQTRGIKGFLESVAARSNTILTRGRAALEALSDDEWNRLVEETNRAPES